WVVTHAGTRKKPEDHLTPVPVPAPPDKKTPPVAVRSPPPLRNSGSSAKGPNAPLIPGGSYTVQVAATTREADAMELASRLQKKKFPAFVLSPQGDKYYRVQVGPYADPKAAEGAR